MTAADTHRQTAADLQAGAAYIERHGWCQYHYLEEDTGAVCANGALRKAIAPCRSRMPASIALGGYLIREGLVCWSGGAPANGAVLMFNDAPERQKAEVLDALQGAAKDELRRADAIDANAPP